MIIPDYDKGAIDVHMKLSEQELSLTEQALCEKAFMYVTGLEPYKTKVSSLYAVDPQDISKVEPIEFQLFQTESFKSICITCGQAEFPEHDATITSTMLVRDKDSNDVVVRLISAIVGPITVRGNIVGMIDFIFRYKDELMTTKSGVII